MDFKPSIILPVPEAEDFEDEPPYVYIPVPSGIVDMGIELLQCFLTQWKQEEGVTPDERVWDAMAISGAQMLSGLMAAWAAHYHGSGLRALVEQIDHYCNQRDVVDPYHSETRERARDLAALREQAQYAPIVDALEALRTERQNRRKEHKQLQVAAEQRPAGANDVGWDF